jgi:uncharacterized membrane protein YhaH (DUF805 family)
MRPEVRIERKKIPMSQPPSDQNPQQPEPPQQPEQPAAPEQPATAPEAPQYGAPQAPQQPQAPQAPQYGAPQPPQQPAAPQYGAPQAPQASQAPQPPQYGAPQPPAAPQYGAPQAPQYGAPQAPQYGAPQQAYGQAPQYGAPQYATPQFQAAPIGTVPGPGGYFDGASNPDDLTRPLYGASFGQAVRRFFKQYAKFSGRASRSEYWWVTLFIFLVELIPLFFYFIGLISLATTANNYDPYSGYSAGPSGFGLAMLFIGVGLLLIVGLGLLVPSIAIAWRRLHDGNFAGPFYFLSFIPYVGGLVLLVFTLMPSKAEGRRFDV